MKNYHYSYYKSVHHENNFEDVALKEALIRTALEYSKG